MGVHRQTGQPEGDATHHICRLATDSGKCHQLIEARWDLTTESHDDVLCHPHQQFERIGVAERAQLPCRAGVLHAQPLVGHPRSSGGCPWSGHGPDTTGSFLWMMSLDIAVVTAPDGHVVDEIDELLSRVTKATGHDALSEHKREALRRTVDRTDASTG